MAAKIARWAAMHGTDFADCACIERGCGDFIEIALPFLRQSIAKRRCGDCISPPPDNREAVRGGSIRVPCNREAMAIRPIPAHGKNRDKPASLSFLLSFPDYCTIFLNILMAV